MELSFLELLGSIALFILFALAAGWIAGVVEVSIGWD